ncbi:ParB/RepB/Spo0J family partition protein [Bradyrhizobium sp. Arg62]|uniref:ParB/RepB/Spo0J family partition protein n=1 Tax=Bradyrhizobium brasilense TaxID=1419277 RepID=UPI001E473150|nr:ParB/RepB/Spo0J family partition protein [Bradyrhizobium brasilense]MCC8949303.1 ParB/RepB/Spo0J family partition protein [Bradyrhizobium brasilense]
MQIIEARLMQLKIDPANVRHTDLAPEESLVASIRAKGVLVPLTVRKNGGDGFYVTDGGKRLAALHVLAQDNEFDKATPIKCVLQEIDAAAAADISLTTNFVREDMHPVDTYEAFATLKANGKSTEDIAKDYGLPIPEVRQYLALGQLSPKVREAWKEGAFSNRGDFDDDEPEEIAQLFTLAGDHDQQDAILEKLKKQKRLTIKWQVRDAIVGNSNKGGQLVAFIGVDAYKAAGGNLREDLFGSDHIVEDLPIARRLVEEKLKAECERMVGLGWSWAEPLSALPKGCEHSWQRAYESAEQFAKTKRKEWGLALYVGRDGELDEYILQKPEQKKAADKAAKTKAAKKAAASGEAPQKDDGRISSALVHRLSVSLTKAASSAVALDTDLSYRMLLAALLSCSGTGISSVRISNRGLGEQDIDEDWDFEQAYAQVLKMQPRQRSDALAHCLGNAFDFQSYNLAPLDEDNDTDARFVCELIDAKAMRAALLKEFDAAGYFGAVSKSLCVKAIRECRPENNYTERDFASHKKADLVNMACDDAHDTGWLPPELRTKHYDGPGSKGWKPSAAKPAAKKAPAKKKAR